MPQRARAAWSRWLAAAVVLVVAVCAWSVFGPGSAGPSPATVDGGAAAPVAAATPADGVVRRELETPAATGAVAATGPAPAAAAVHRGTLQALVVDEFDVALAGCTVEVEDQRGITDAAGRVDLPVSAARLLVSATPPANLRRRPASGWQTFAPAAVTTVRLVLLPAGDRPFCVRLLRSEDRAPVVGAVLLRAPGGERAQSDADGRVQMLAEPGEGWFDVTAAGRAPLRLLPEVGHEATTAAMEVLLAPGASLAFTVLDAAERPVGEAALSLTAMSWHLQWPPGSAGRGQPFRRRSAAPTADGTLSFTDLPAGVPLTAELELPPGVGAAPPLEPLVLQPGPNARRCVLAAPAVVAGVALDHDGAPLTGARVGCVPATGAVEPVQFPFAELDRGKATPTAADGSFTLAVPPGDFWCGIDTHGAGAPRWPGRALPVLRVTALAGRTVRVELRAASALQIGGRALTPDGQPVAGLWLNLERDGMAAGGARTDTAGRFLFDGLRAGRHLLSSEPYADRLGLLQPLAVEAGQDRLEVRLEAAYGRLRGQVLEAATGRPATAFVLARQRDGDDAFGRGCDLDGSFDHPGLRPGTWDVLAADRRGRCAVQTGVPVAPGVDGPPLRLLLQPGGVLLPQHPTADTFEVRSGVEVLTGDNLQPGVPGEAVVPPGDYEVVFRAGAREVARSRVRVRAGDRLPVTGG